MDYYGTLHHHDTLQRVMVLFCTVVCYVCRKIRRYCSDGLCLCFVNQWFYSHTAQCCKKVNRAVFGATVSSVHRISFRNHNDYALFVPYVEDKVDCFQSEIHHPKGVLDYDQTFCLHDFLSSKHQTVFCHARGATRCTALWRPILAFARPWTLIKTPASLSWLFSSAPKKFSPLFTIQLRQLNTTLRSTEAFQPRIGPPPSSAFHPNSLAEHFCSSLIIRYYVLRVCRQTTATWMRKKIITKKVFLPWTT